MDPNKSSLYVIQADAGSSVANTAAYYIECTGVNPLANDIGKYAQVVHQKRVRILLEFLSISWHVCFMCRGVCVI